MAEIKEKKVFSTELAYARIIEAIDGDGYNGWFGLEYFPTGDAVSSLDELRAYLDARGVRGEGERTQGVPFEKGTP